MEYFGGRLLSLGYFELALGYVSVDNEAKTI